MFKLPLQKGGVRDADNDQRHLHEKSRVADVLDSSGCEQCRAGEEVNCKPGPSDQNRAAKKVVRNKMKEPE